MKWLTQLIEFFPMCVQHTFNKMNKGTDGPFFPFEFGTMGLDEVLNGEQVNDLISIPQGRTEQGYAVVNYSFIYMYNDYRSYRTATVFGYIEIFHCPLINLHYPFALQMLRL